MYVEKDYSESKLFAGGQVFYSRRSVGGETMVVFTRLSLLTLGFLQMPSHEWRN